MKEHFMRFSALVSALSLCCASAAVAAPAAGSGTLKPGEASGKLTVNGESAALTHAYLTPDQGSTVITLTNIPVGPEFRNQVLMFEKRDPVKQGKLYLMNVKLDAKGQVQSCDIYHRKLGQMQHTNVVGLNSFEKVELAAGHVRGRAFMKSPFKSADGGEEIFYDVSFDATR
jgi:hypothetical protein